MTSQHPHALTAARSRAFLPFRTPVRGHSFAARPPDAEAPRAGQAARLVRESGNPRDELAIAVWVGGRSGPWRIGYLDRAVAARLAPRLDHAGLRLDVRVTGWQPEPDGRWQRPVVELVPVTGSGDAPAVAPEASGRRGEPPRSTVRTVR